jgi:hypothetical protein
MPQTLINSHVRLLTDEQLTSNVITRQEIDEPPTSREKDMTSRADSLLSSNPLILHSDSLQSSSDDAPVDKLDREPMTSEDAQATGADNPDFVLFWEKYPKRNNIGEAMKAWDALAAQGIPSKYIIQAAMRYASKERELGTETRFLKAPQNFLTFSVLREYLPRSIPDCPRCRGQGGVLVIDDDGGSRTQTCDCWSVIMGRETHESSYTGRTIGC